MLYSTLSHVEKREIRIAASHCEICNSSSGCYLICLHESIFVTNPQEVVIRRHEGITYLDVLTDNLKPFLLRPFGRYDQYILVVMVIAGQLKRHSIEEILHCVLQCIVRLVCFPVIKSNYI